MSLFFCFLGENMRWNANSLSARMLHLLHQFVPDLDSVTLFLPTASNTSYSLSGIGRFDKSLLCPHKMGRNSVCPRQVSHFCGLDKSTIPPVYLQLSTLLSCCSPHFFPVRVLASFCTSSFGSHAQ